jgi:hypothetical protein
MIKFVYKEDCSMGKKGDVCEGVYGDSLMLGTDGKVYEKQRVSESAHVLQNQGQRYWLFDVSDTVEVKFGNGFEGYYYGDLFVDEEGDVFEVVASDETLFKLVEFNSNSGNCFMGEVYRQDELVGLRPFESVLSKRDKLKRILKADALDVDDELVDALMEVVNEH